MQVTISNVPVSEINPISAKQIDREVVEFESEQFDAVFAEKQDYAIPTWKSSEIITTLAGLKKLIRTKLAGKAVLAVDTETSVALEKRAEAARTDVKQMDQSARLCLIQIGVPAQRKLSNGGVKIYPDKPGKNFLISMTQIAEDVERLEAKSGKKINPLEPLKKILEDPDVTLLIQFASFEDRQFWKYGICMEGVQDTCQLARSFRPDLPAYNLAALALEIGGIPLSKEEQTSNWDDWPLTSEQIDYALLDTEITAKIWCTLQGHFARADQETATVVKNRDPEEILNELKTLEWAEHNLLQDAGLYKTELELRARAKKYRAALSEVLKTEYLAAEKSAKNGFSALKGISDKSNFGHAYHRRLPVYEVQEEIIEQIDPRILPTAKVPKLSKKVFVAWIKEQIQAGALKKCNPDKLWQAVTHPGGRTTPKLILELEGLPPQEDFQKVYAALQVPENLEIKDMLRTIMEAELTRARLLRLADIGNELALIKLKKKIISEVLLEELVEQNRDAKTGEIAARASFELGADQVSYTTKAARRQFDYDLLRDRFPGIFNNQDIYEITKGRVEEALKKLKRFNRPMRQEILEQAFIKTDIPGRADSGIYPAYAKYYKGIEQPEQAEEQQLAA